MTALFHPRWLHPLLLLVWLVIGIGLRFANLTAKPPWTDEFSTLVFSLGNSFLPVPLDQAIAIDVLLKPLQPQAGAGIHDVLTHLLSETNHPPLYFVLAHWWMRLFPTEGDLVSLWGARSLAALFGGASVPAIYALSWFSFRSRLVSHFAAAMMATSPYAIFLAQEARHYTLATLWVIASLGCLVIAARHIQNRTQLPWWLALSWVGINAFGIATHYFFTLTLISEALVLIFLAWQYRTKKFKIQNYQCPLPNAHYHFPFSLLPPWKRIYVVAAGTFVAGLVWLPTFLHNSYGAKLTEWIQGPREGWAWVSPIFQALAAWITMISLLPVEVPQLVVVIASGMVMLMFFIWAVPVLVCGIKVQLKQPETRLLTQVFAGIVVCAIALFFVFTYFFGIDLTRGARYNFVYFPAVIVLLGASLAVCWHTSQDLTIKEFTGKDFEKSIEVLRPPEISFSKSRVESRLKRLPASKEELGKHRNHSKLQLGAIGKWGLTGKKAVIIIFLMGLLSGITVIFNFGYQKYYRPDLLVPLIEQTSHVPVLIATTHKTHVQIGEMMGIAREFKIHNSLSSTSTKHLLSPQFLLAHQDQDPKTSTITLQNTLKVLPVPFDLWLINFHAPVAVNSCIAENQSLPLVNGYEYKIYHCN